MMIISFPDTQQGDTISVCSRNSIADISFYDSNNVVIRQVLDPYNGFPFLFLEKTKQIQLKERTFLIKHLKPGDVLPSQPLHNDLIIGILLIAAFLYSLTRSASGNMLPEVARFFLFRGINDPSSRNTSGLFSWQSTMLNLISFLIFGLFAFCAASYFDFIPAHLGGIFFWLISLGIIISAATFRHITCVITSKMSGEREAFKEYMVVTYLSYRFSALFLFMLIILISYTGLLPARGSFISGVFVLGIMYLISIIRLMLIFLNRNISIFYLILYLCALEILPVVISVKYFAGLV